MSSQITHPRWHKTGLSRSGLIQYEEKNVPMALVTNAYLGQQIVPMMVVTNLDNDDNDSDGNKS